MDPQSWDLDKSVRSPTDAGFTDYKNPLLAQLCQSSQLLTYTIYRSQQSHIHDLVPTLVTISIPLSVRATRKNVSYSKSLYGDLTNRIVSPIIILVAISAKSTGIRIRQIWQACIRTSQIPEALSTIISFVGGLAVLVTQKTSFPLMRRGRLWSRV